MSEEKRLMIENDLCMSKSKAQVIKLYLDLMEQYNKEIDKLTKQNNDLRKIYRNTYKKLFDNGNDELARYFQAQIDECPTFYVEPIIDYYKEYNKQKEVLDKIKEYIENLLKEEFEITDPDNINYGEKCQRVFFSDSELIKILELLEEIE